MDTAFFSVLRVYKNAAGDTIRIDEVSLSGFFMRKNLFANWTRDRDYNPNRNMPGEPYYDLNAPIFHCNARGRRVSTEMLIVGGSRVVAEIEMVGQWITLGAAPNYTSATWRGGTVDMSDLPVVGDTV